LRINRLTGNLDAEGHALQSLGDLALDEGDLVRARSLLIMSLQRHARTGSTLRLPRILDSIAVFSSAIGDPARAIRLVAASTAMLQETGAVREPRWQATLEQRLAPARRQLGDEATKAAEVAGRAMTLQAAIAEALQVGEPGQVQRAE
jgi:pilus assembly protein TadC